MAKKRKSKATPARPKGRVKPPPRARRPGGNGSRGRNGNGDGNGNGNGADLLATDGIAVPARPVAAAPDADPADATTLPYAADDSPPRVAFPVVGIGASAGGLDAFSRVLKALPAKPGLAVVIVQHLAPEYESALPTLLGSTSVLPVVQVSDGMRLEVNRVHVIPPDRNMALTPDGRFSLLARQERRAQFLPIDFFMHSLAGFARERAIGVILSGDLSDGAFGIKEIKGAGGITFAQDPKNASRGEMPRSAIATGLVDRVLAPEQIAEELVQIARHPLLQLPGPGDAARPRRGGATLTGAAARAAEAGLDQDDLARVFALLRSSTGVDFTHYKLPTIRRRLQRRMVLHKIADLSRYVKLLQQRPEEVKNLYGDILINVTRFFREPESFAVLADKALPEILAARHEDGGGGGRVPGRRRRRAAKGGPPPKHAEQPLRVWVPGCSTGEEPYSIAISLLERLDGAAMEMPVQIFATDISDAAIEHARAGIYPASIEADVSPERLRRFFNKIDGSYRISKAVRDLCIFARQDLTRDPPFSRLDLVVCRNVLIYLGPVLQKRLMQVFHYALNPTGFLMLGTAETVGSQVDLFSVVDKVHRLYAKRQTGVRRAPPSGPVAPAGHGGAARPREESGALRTAAATAAAAAAGGTPGARGASNVQNEANRILLNRYTPPGVIVDDDLTIVQFRGQTGPYLEPAPGEASLNLLKMVREGLLYGLRNALQEARRNNTAVRKDGLRVRVNNTWRQLSVEAIPISSVGDGRHFLVIFDDIATRGTAAGAAGDAFAAAPQRPPAAPAKGKAGKAGGKSSKRGKGKAGAGAAADPPGAEQRIARLEFELGASREYLQAIIQDLEAANEELQSANEEILSANEELQSTNEELDTAKEELQSTNEELNTVNEELQGRNEELSRVNSDLVNLLGSVQIAIVMVANDLKIRRFTPMAERLFNLIPGDVGRRISDIKPNFNIPDFERRILNAIETVTVREESVADTAGNVYSLRIRPYKNLDNKIDGAVVALIDLAERAGGGEGRDAKLAQDRVDVERIAREFAEAVINTVREPLLVLRHDLTVRSANHAFYHAFAVDPLDTEGRPVYQLGEGHWDIPRLRELLENVLSQHESFEGYEVEHEFPGLGRRRMLLNARRVLARGGRPPLILLAIEDVTGKTVRGKVAKPGLRIKTAGTTPAAGGGWA